LPLLLLYPSGGARSYFEDVLSTHIYIQISQKTLLVCRLISVRYSQASEERCVGVWQKEKHGKSFEAKICYLIRAKICSVNKMIIFFFFSLLHLLLAWLYIFPFGCFLSMVLPLYVCVVVEKIIAN
jgi:hypothetical protein